MIRTAWFLFLTGCTSWHTATVSPSVLLSTKQPEKVRVTRPDRSNLVIYGPTIERDSLVGVTYLLVEADSTVAVGNPRLAVTQARAALALGDIQRIQARRLSVGRTLALAGGVGLGALIVTAIAVGEILGADPQFFSESP